MPRQQNRIKLSQPVSYCSNSSSTKRIILSRDIELNSGPKTLVQQPKLQTAEAEFANKKKSIETRFVKYLPKRLEKAHNI